MSRISSGSAAAKTPCKRISKEKFDLVVAVMRLGDMDPFSFGRQVKEIDPELPVIGLAYNTPELKRLLEMDDGTALERIFVWQGDGHVLLGIIQFIEDRKNAANDTQAVGVQNILLIEDSIEFYSSYLPLIFSVLRDLTENLLKEDLTFSQKLLRQNARPRVHLATTYEEADAVFDKFKDNLLGIITDASFPARPGRRSRGRDPLREKGPGREAPSAHPAAIQRCRGGGHGPRLPASLSCPRTRRPCCAT